MSNVYDEYADKAEEKRVNEVVTMREAVKRVLRENGLTDNPAEHGLSGIHSWRCEHPDRYGKCDCFSMLVDDLMDLIKEKR